MSRVVSKSARVFNVVSRSPVNRGAPDEEEDQHFSVADMFNWIEGDTTIPVAARYPDNAGQTPGLPDRPWYVTGTWANSLLSEQTYQNVARPLDIYIKYGIWNAVGTFGSNQNFLDRFVNPVRNIGVRNGRIQGYGSLFHRNTFGAPVAMGADPPTGWRVASVEAGADRVTCITPAEAAFFVPGRWLLMTGIDLQGFGFPPNPYYFEHHRIGTSDDVTGEITLADVNGVPSRLRYSYRDEWPEWNPGDPLHDSAGGPAMIYNMEDEWDKELIWDGISCDPSGSQLATAARRLKFINCWVKTGGLAASNAQMMIFEGGAPGKDHILEVDKLVRTFISRDVKYHPSLLVQSGMSFSEFDNCAMDGLTGTTRSTLVSDSQIPKLLMTCPRAYGTSDDLLIENSHLGEFEPLPIRHDIDDFDSPIVNGELRYTRSGNSPKSWGNPGVSGFLLDGFEALPVPFQVLSVTFDTGVVPTKAVMHTTLPDPIPTFSGTVTIDRAGPSPVPRTTFNIVTGKTPDGAILPHDGADTCPTYSYWRCSWIVHPSRPGDINGSFARFKNWGTLVSFTINVYRPYTGVAANMILRPGIASGPEVVKPDLTGVAWRWGVNLKIAGKRVVTPTEITGEQAGDDLADLGDPPGEIWFFTDTLLWTGVNTTAEAMSVLPHFEVELILDQGIYVRSWRE